MIGVETAVPANVDRSVAKTWLKALELTAPIQRNPNRVLPTVIEELAARLGDSPALLSERENLTYRELAERSNQYARWALEQGLAKGDVVCLLMTNRPEYFAIWLGITSVGGVVTLLNTNLVGPSLSHCIHIVSPKHIIVSSEFVDALTTSLLSLTMSPKIWTHGVEHTSYNRIDLEIARRPGDTLTREERRPITIEDRALYIYTSGTTGLPKAASVSHARVLQWSYWFSGMMGAQRTDRMYNCLPMYHSIGGVLVPGALLVSGGTVVVREKFSASRFWTDVIHWDCTMFQYIGELCRYLLNAAPSSDDMNHRIRLACGNGLASEIWNGFKERFRIPQILEFYAATEGNISLFNIEGKRGAIGHIPSYLAHRFSPALVRFDVDKNEPVRDDDGFCIRCAPNEIGEAIGKILDEQSHVTSRFEGYTDKKASDEKILRNVFEQGDAWVRTGDLMRKDQKGYFYFVDRIGDTFRWKGENVATSEVSEVISSFSGVKHANVYGVAIPGTEGRGGMATLVVEHDMSLPALREHLMSCLPTYARPLFLRICDDISVTATFKYSKADLVRQGYDPTATDDIVYFDDPESGAFVQLDKTLYDQIQGGQIRL
jgi:fatty-acyl-CoA synthase